METAVNTAQSAANYVVDVGGATVRLVTDLVVQNAASAGDFLRTLINGGV